MCQKSDSVSHKKPSSEGIPTVFARVDGIVMRHFPGALKSTELASRVESALSKHGYDNKTTLLATSLCCDEVNRELEQTMIDVYGENFSMGGLAGFAFGGVTSFCAMAHHIPEGGSCAVLYGPHVGIDDKGNVGKINRRGRMCSGACCGSAAAAMGYVKSVKSGEVKAAAPPQECTDAQQTFVGNMLLPYGQRLEDAKNAQVELPLALFDSQDELMQKIVAGGCGEVHSPGNIALIGGIQINTPAGTSEFFLPKVFEIRNNKGELVANLIDTLYVVEPEASKQDDIFSVMIKALTLLLLLLTVMSLGLHVAGQRTNLMEARQIQRDLQMGNLYVQENEDNFPKRKKQKLLL
eukprot:scaffold7745_cov55-Attheya_sp.AAC.4